MLRYANYGVVFQEIPGETTLSINISGCPIRCEGCHSQYLWEDTGRLLDYAEIDRLIDKYVGEITCVSLMGGDASPETVNALLLHVRVTYPELKTAWYSGRQLLSTWVSLSNLDYLKLGPYIKEMGGLKNPKTNQRFYRIDGDYLNDITSYFWKNGSKE